VDSSVGGKTGVDLPEGKNLVGAFYQPRLVLIDPNVLASLPDSTFADGMAEVVKYGYISNREILTMVSQPDYKSNIENIIYECVKIKRDVVAIDEHDTGLRMILNFGHTIGHAFELAGNYETWSHGQGVAAGMNWAAQIGFGLGVTPEEAILPVQDILKKYGLPLDIPCPWDVMTHAVLRDKKNLEGRINLILMESLGRAAPHPVSLDQLLEQLEAMYGR